MKDPTKKSDWTLSWCVECRMETSFWRVKEHLFRCMACGITREIREIDHDRDGVLE